MDDICRLCCSKNFVNNNIFNEENALYLKMSLYLPIKVSKTDRLPQKVCDKCSCKINDFYQFCNETIEVQNRLRSYLLSSDTGSEDIVDLTRIKEDTSPLPGSKIKEQSTQTEWDEPTIHCNNATIHDVQVKEEPRTLSPVKEENVYDDYLDLDGLSDNSDDMTLITLKKKKKNKKADINGVEKKPRKKKPKLDDLEILMNALPKGTKLSLLDRNNVPVKKELQEGTHPIKVQNFDVLLDVKQVKNEPGEGEAINCCICMMQCYSKNEMIQHYREHGREVALPAEPPPAPPPPRGEDPLRCVRCRKALAAREWAAHWARHWERDRRPYACALCERTFREPHQVYKHGLTHKQVAGTGAGAGAAEPLDKRFICDLCPESFVYMRYLHAHRARAHPEAGARAVALRCGLCARQFAHLNSLRRHLRAHSGERNHLCNVCGKALSSREHLKFHIRIHTGYKPNVCKTCGKGFVKKCNLTLHERVHSGEKPHVCSHCGKAFSQRSTLVIHERYHSGARPYVCALCGRGFVAKGLLSMHLKTTCI